MTLPEISIRRHVLAWMISGIFVLFGIISIQKIGLDRFPMIEFPILSVTTTLEGANPEIIDASITNIIEGAVNATTGIESIKSSSSPGVSVVTITFNLEKDIEVAFNEIQSKVGQVARRLPDDIVPPVVRKVETNASPIMWLGFTGDRTIQQLNLYARNTLKKQLETIQCEMNPGDALFFHPNTLHCSASNLSDKARWALICCYNAKSNNPFKESHHPSYTKLDKVSDDQVAIVGKDDAKRSNVEFADLISDDKSAKSLETD